MKPISHRQRGKIACAVAERAIGSSWDKIAQKVNRHVAAVKRWPKRYADLWRALEYEEEVNLSSETAKETVFILRNLFRNQPPTEQIKSAALLIRLLIERQKIDLRAMQAGLLHVPEE